MDRQLRAGVVDPDHPDGKLALGIQMGLYRPMRCALSLLAASSMLLVACQPLEEAAIEPPCNGLRIEVVDQVAAPPANVAARVRITTCEEEPLGLLLDPKTFVLAEDDEVLTDLEAQRLVRPLDRDTVQLTLVALDLSGSVVRSGLREQMVDGARRLVDTLAPRQSVAIFGFDGRPDLVPFSYFTSDTATLHEGLDKLLSAPLVDDSTNLHGAAISAVALLDEAVRVEVERNRVAQGALVLFTDGTDHAGRETLSDAQDKLEDSDHAAFTIGVGAELDAETLAALGPDGTAIAPNAQQIAVAFEHIAELVEARARTDYLVSYCSPARAGAHQLAIRARTGERSGEAKVGFTAERFGAGCDPAAAPLRE